MKFDSIYDGKCIPLTHKFYNSLVALNNFIGLKGLLKGLKIYILITLNPIFFINPKSEKVNNCCMKPVSHTGTNMFIISIMSCLKEAANQCVNGTSCTPCLDEERCNPETETGDFYNEVKNHFFICCNLTLI